MKIKIICIGKLKERYWTEAIAEYTKRMKAYAALDIVELKEERAAGIEQGSEITRILNSEGEQILKRIGERDYVITLEIEGKNLSSVQLAEHMEKWLEKASGSLVFVIGGSHGLSEGVKARANFKLSFSKQTFPHQMMRVMLLEQIYRSFKIIRGEEYHK